MYYNFLGNIESCFIVIEIAKCLKLLNDGYLLSGSGSGSGTETNTIKLWDLSNPNSNPIKIIRNTNSISAIDVLSKAV
jgi:hypothetical protein